MNVKNSWTVLGSPKICGQFWVVQKFVDSRATLDMIFHSNEQKNKMYQ